MYTAYVLTDESRARLLAHFSPAYEHVIAHHITYEFGVKADANLPDSLPIFVIDRVDSGDGLDVLVVMVGAKIFRPDEGIYHITWSIDPNSGYKPKDSNKLLRGIALINTTPIVEVDAIPTLVRV